MPSTFTEFLQDRVLLRDGVATLILFLTVMILRYAAVGFVRRRLPSNDKFQLRWAAQIRGFSYAILALGLFIIWAAELQALAVSFAVLAMAVVWAMRETFACVQGAAYRISSNAFQVGDRINVGGVRGDVIDTGLLGTLVLEVAQGHQRTGRTISIPNSLFMTEPVLNESLAGEYMLHLMTIPVDRNSDLAAIERKALTAAQEACAGFLEDVRRPMAARYRRHGLNPPIVDPRITYQVVDKNTVNILLRIPTPIRLERQVEQRVLRAVLGVPKGRDTLPPPPPP
ncbi:MAG: mechanosensitive ion channel family protein [Deltaproteobacteria bacterium]|jgi:small-conductance mechanosensitive channel|nr:mechanosensitive ion channel family protein [Deltaproteobacteria bacterium]MBW2588536.1 mechanosensitive ion channel family protein [Deltaproteobacteria bacterium]